MPAFLSELGFLGLEGDSGDFVAVLSGDCAGVGWWFFGVPLPFVLPGHPHPGPLPLLMRILGERGFCSWSMEVLVGVLEVCGRSGC